MVATRITRLYDRLCEDVPYFDVLCHGRDAVSQWLKSSQL